MHKRTMLTVYYGHGLAEIRCGIAKRPIREIHSKTGTPKCIELLCKRVKYIEYKADSLPPRGLAKPCSK